MAEVLIDTEDSEEIVEFFRNDNAYDFFVSKITVTETLL